MLTFEIPWMHHRCKNCHYYSMPVLVTLGSLGCTRTMPGFGEEGTRVDALPALPRAALTQILLSSAEKESAHQPPPQVPQFTKPRRPTWTS